MHSVQKTFSRLLFWDCLNFPKATWKFKQSILKSVIHAHLLLLAGLKQTIKLNMIVCETWEAICHGMISENSRASVREGGINQVSHLDWDSNGSTLLSELVDWNHLFCCTWNVVSPMFAMFAFWQTRVQQLADSMDSKRQIQTQGKCKCVYTVHWMWSKF